MPEANPSSNTNVVDTLFDQVENEIARNPDDHARQRIARLLRIFDESAASTYRDTEDAHATLVRCAIEIMASNVHAPLTISQIASQCQVSPTLLKQTFKAVIGVPIYQWYRNHRLTRACSLLTETDLSIAQISVAVGYSNPSKFAKAFREEIGMAPRDWRNASCASRET